MKKCFGLLLTMGLVLGLTACKQKAPQPQAGARTETTEKAGAEAAEAPGGNGENAAGGTEASGGNGENAAGGAEAPRGSGENAAGAAQASGGAGELPAFSYNITMPTGSMGGSYYTIGTAMSEIFTSNMNGVTISASAANTSDDIAALTNNETMIAMAGAPDYVFVMEELPTESGDIDSVGVFNQLVSVIVVKADSPYQTLDDLVGKKINLGAAGSASVCLTRH